MLCLCWQSRCGGCAESSNHAQHRVHNIELSNPLLATPHHPPDELFNFRPFTRLEVKSVILSVQSNKSSGPDEVGIRVIKDCLTEILDPLTDIITAYLSYLRFLTRGKFPKLYHC